MTQYKICQSVSMFHLVFISNSVLFVYLLVQLFPSNELFLFDISKLFKFCIDNYWSISHKVIHIQIGNLIAMKLLVVVQLKNILWHFNQLLLIIQSNSNYFNMKNFNQLYSFFFFSIAFNLPTVTSADITSADNYIQQLLWLITPQYKGEPGYRNYTIAMILIFIAISGVVVHVLLFGIMCPF